MPKCCYFYKERGGSTRQNRSFIEIFHRYPQKIAVGLSSSLFLLFAADFK
jgi:hypothetical protein